MGRETTTTGRRGQRQGGVRDVRAGALVAVAGVLALGLWGTGCAPSNGRPWIHKIYIDGAKQVKAGTIRGKLAIQQAPLLPWSSKHYLEHPYMVEVERERIETVYRSRGFYSARVTKAEVKPYKTGKKPSVDVRYTVEEGDPTFVRKRTVNGLSSIGEDGVWVQKRIEKLPAIKEGAIFEHPQYLLDKEKIENFLHLRGYPFAQVKSDVAVDRELYIADVTVDIEPGHKARIGKVTVEGTHKTDPEAIIKHTALIEGEQYRPDLLDAAQGKLYNQGIFSTVLLEPVPNPDDPSVADIHINVSEGKFRELDLGIGFGIEPLRTEVHGEISFTKRNFFGGLRKFEVGLRAGYAAVPAFWSSEISRHGPLATLRFEFVQPDKLGRNSEISASVVYDLGIDYAYQYHGPGARLGIQKSFWRNRIKIAASYNFQFLDFFDTDPAILSDPGGSGLRYGYTDPYRLAYLQQQIVLDLRNRPIDATRGFYAAAVAEEGGIWTGGAFDYQKLLGEARGYVPIGSRIVFAARVQFGQIFVQSDLGSPITQRLYLGGPSSHRGFTYNRLSQQVCSARDMSDPSKPEMALPGKVACLRQGADGLTDFRRLPIGGDQSLLAQLEMRVNLFKLAGQWFSMAGFVDAGDVAAPSCGDKGCENQSYLGALDLRRLHVAVGGGLRYRTVVGAIRFDLGVRLNRLDPVEDGIENPDPGQRIAYHISIGEAF